MKFLIMVLTIISLQAAAQVATAPDGAGNVTAPPVGDERRSSCSTKGCFEVNIQPYCFGTNLRAYSSDIQLNATDPVLVNLQVGGASGDKLDFRFPPTLTFNPNGVKQACFPKSGQNLNSPGVKTFVCTLTNNGVSESVEYSISDWKGSKNPSCYANGGSHGQTYCDYAARPLPANRISGSAGDPNITCFYSFTGSYALKDEVICQFPSLMADESSKVSVKLNGSNLTNSEIKAFTNKIQVKIPLTALNYINANSQFKNGKRMMPKTGQALPSSVVTFAQIRPNGSARPLETANYQLPDRTARFDEANQNMSYTIIAKFPGSEGFCGGFYSPLMLFFSNEYPSFTGVSTFPLHGVKEGSRVNWPEAGSKGYFLAALEGDEKEITKASQLFGQDDVYDNGFESLKIHDTDGNGIINKKDKIWGSLKLWKDDNANGLSEPEEIHSLRSKGVDSISLKYSSRFGLKFENRARGRERSTFTYIKNGKSHKADIIDVWLSPID